MRTNAGAGGRSTRVWLLWAPVVLVVAGAWAVPAGGEDIAVIGVEPPSGPPGSSVTVTGHGFCGSGCTPITVEYGGVAAATDVPVAADGSFTAVFKVTGSSAQQVAISAWQRNAAGAELRAWSSFAPFVGENDAAEETARDQEATTEEESPDAPSTTVDADESKADETDTSADKAKESGEEAEAAEKSRVDRFASAPAASESEGRALWPWVVAITAGALLIVVTLVARRRSTSRT